jgi:glucose uptake protein GlcU
MLNTLTIGALIWFTYTLIAINTCAIARAQYLPTAVSSLAFMVANFFLIRHVAEAQTTREFVAYLVGGVLGDLSGIYISKKARIL